MHLLNSQVSVECFKCLDAWGYVGRFFCLGLILTSLALKLTSKT